MSRTRRRQISPGLLTRLGICGGGDEVEEYSNAARRVAEEAVIEIRAREEAERGKK